MQDVFEVITDHMRAALFLTSLFTHNQISALSQLVSLQPQHKWNWMWIYGNELNTSGTVEDAGIVG